MRSVLAFLFLIPGVAMAVSYDDYQAAQKLARDAYQKAAANEYQEAITLAESSWKLDPDKERNRYPLELKASCYASLGNFAGAAEAFKVALATFQEANDPRACDAYFGYAQALSRLGRPTEAITTYKTLLAIHAETVYKNNLAWVIATAPDLETRESGLALSLAKEAVAATKETDALVLDTYAAALAESGKFDEAIVAQGKAIALIGQDKAFSYNLRIKLYQKKIKFRTDIDVDKAMRLLADGPEKL